MKDSLLRGTQHPARQRDLPFSLKKCPQMSCSPTKREKVPFFLYLRGGRRRKSRGWLRNYVQIEAMWDYGWDTHREGGRRVADPWDLWDCCWDAYTYHAAAAAAHNEESLIQFPRRRRSQQPVSQCVCVQGVACGIM